MNSSEYDQYEALVKASQLEDKRCRMAVQDGDFGAAERHAATAAYMLESAHKIADGTVEPLHAAASA